MTTVDLTDVSEANQRAIAAFCAEFVMGWKPPGHPDVKAARAAVNWEHSTYDFYWLDPSSGRLAGRSRVPNPFKSADDDYAVLVHVKETFSRDKMTLFSGLLGDIWVLRYFKKPMGEKFKAMCMIFAAEYEPGNYCLAASRVIQGEADAEDV